MEKEWSKACEALSILTDAVLAEVPDKELEIYFIASEDRIITKNHNELMEKISTQQAIGCTLLHEKVDVILSDQVRRYARVTKNDQQSGTRGGEALSFRKLNLIILTNGIYLEHDSAVDDLIRVIVQNGRELDDLYAPQALVGLQFVQIGGTEHVTKVLEWLDNELHNTQHLKR